MANIAVLGHGVVGSGVLEVLTSHAASIAKRAKEEIHVKYILDLKEFPGLPYSDRFTKDFNVILNDPEVQIVVEVMGGLHPAYDFVKACLENGKSVVTSNKELVAQKGAELLAIAQANNLNFLFEASVGGGIPIIRPISQCLAANDVTEIAGILNGTTNFILTKMIREQMNFEDALKLAQQLGYAERNPSADVEGLDACRKVCILSALSFGSHVYPDMVSMEGITRITEADVAVAAAGNMKLKLLGRTLRTDDGRVCAFVSPHFVPMSCQLAHADGVFNALLVRGNAIGEAMFYGPGAGKLPTASAVAGDLADAAWHLTQRRPLDWEDARRDRMLDAADLPLPYVIRTDASAEQVEAALGAARPLGDDGYLLEGVHTRRAMEAAGLNLLAAWPVFR